MNIVVIAPSLGDAFGQERATRDSIRLLRKHGHRVAAVVGEQNTSSLAVDGYLLIPELNSLNFFSPRKSVNTVLKMLLSFLKEINPQVVHFSEAFDPVITKAVSEHYPTVLTAHMVSPSCPASHRLKADASFCKKRSGWSCLFHQLEFHCLDSFPKTASRVHAVFEFQRKKEALKDFSRLIAVSQFLKETLVFDGVESERVEVVYNPVGLARGGGTSGGPPSPEGGRFAGRPPSPVLVVAARLVRLKGVDLVLEALSLIPELSWQLWVLGSGPEDNSLREQIERLGLSKRVTLWGKTSYEEAQYAMQLSHAVIQFNRGVEAFGMAVAEAGALGKPVIASDLPALNEIILANKTGLLVPQGEAQALAQAIKTILLDTNLRNTLGMNAQAHVRREFSESQHLEKLLRVYQEVSGSLEKPATFLSAKIQTNQKSA